MFKRLRKEVISKGDPMANRCQQERIEQKLIRLKRKIEEKQREVFHKSFSTNPTLLYKELVQHKKQLDLLVKKKIIDKHQYFILFPTSCQTNSDEFDTTLLHVLLRNLFSFKRPTTGWNDEPLSTDRSVIANLIRLKIARNRISHLGLAAANNTIYRKIYKYLKTPLLELGCTIQELNDLVPKPLRFKYVRSIKNFAERNNDITQIHQEIHRCETQKLMGLCLSGLSGIGKSQTVKKYFETYSRHFEHNVIWIDGSNIEESFKELAQHMNLTVTDEHGHMKSNNVVISEVHNFFDDEKVLFIFDNLDLEWNNPNCTRDVMKYFPAFDSTISIITSRYEINHPLFANIIIKPLTEVSALNYVQANLGLFIHSQSDLAQIIEILGYHPLAIEKFISYVKETRIPIASYLTLIQDDPRMLLENNHFGTNLFVRASVEKAKAFCNKLTHDVLDLSVYLNGKDIKRGFLMKYFTLKCDESGTKRVLKDLNESLRLLEKFSLVYIEKDANDYTNDTITCHSLVQETTRYLQKEEKRDEAIFHALCKNLFQDNKACSNDQTFINFETFLLFHKQVLYIFYRYMDDKKFLEICVENVSIIYNMFFFSDRLDVSEDIFKKLITFLEGKIVASRWPISNYWTKRSLLKVQSYLGQIYFDKRESGQAFEVLDEVRLDQKKLVGRNHTEYLLTTLSYVKVLSFESKFQQSMELSKKLLRKFHKKLGATHPNTLSTQKVIAMNYLHLGDRAQSMKLYGQVLSGQLQTYPPHHPSVLNTRHDLAMVQVSTKRENTLASILTDLLKVFDESNFFVLRTKYNIGMEKINQCQYSEALVIMEDVFSRMVLKYGEKHELVREIEGFVKYLTKIN